MVGEGKIMDHLGWKEKTRYVFHSESLVNAGMVNIQNETPDARQSVRECRVPKDWVFDQYFDCECKHPWDVARGDECEAWKKWNDEKYNERKCLIS